METALLIIGIVLVMFALSALLIAVTAPRQSMSRQSRNSCYADSRVNASRQGSSYNPTSNATGYLDTYDSSPVNTYDYSSYDGGGGYSSGDCGGSDGGGCGGGD